MGALHYNIEDLDDGEKKTQRHSQQVPKSQFTNCASMHVKQVLEE